MNQPVNQDGDWHCGGWEGAQRETYRTMQAMTFDQKLDWLEGAQQLVAEMHGWEAALLPGGSAIVPRWKQPATPQGGPSDHSTDGGEVGAGGGVADAEPRLS